MMHTLLSIALVASVAFQGALAEFGVVTPEVTQCKDIKISWDKTEGPYNVLVVSANDPCGDAIADLGDVDENSLTWTPKVPAGTKVMFSILDGNDDEGWSGSITIKESTNDDCLSSSSTKKGSSSSAGSGSTLVVSPTVSAKTTTNTVAPVGAAGADPLSGDSDNGVPAIRFSVPVMVLAAVAALALAL